MPEVFNTITEFYPDKKQRTIFIDKITESLQESDYNNSFPKETELYHNTTYEMTLDLKVKSKLHQKIFIYKFLVKITTCPNTIMVTAIFKDYFDYEYFFSLKDNTKSKNQSIILSDNLTKVIILSILNHLLEQEERILEDPFVLL